MNPHPIWSTLAASMDIISDIGCTAAEELAADLAPGRMLFGC